MLASPGTLRTYEYCCAVAILDALIFFCLVCDLSVVFVCLFLSSITFSLFVFLVMSAVEGGKDAVFLPVNVV